MKKSLIIQLGIKIYQSRYEYFKDFILNEYELGEYNPDLVAISDSLRLNATNDPCTEINNVVESKFVELNSIEGSSGYNVLICQGKDICLPIEKCYKDATEKPNVSLLLEMGYVSTYSPSIQNVDVFSVIGKIFWEKF